MIYPTENIKRTMRMALHIIYICVVASCSVEKYLGEDEYLLKDVKMDYAEGKKDLKD